MENSKPVIAIVGGGFSGMMTAVNLCQLSEDTLKIVIVNAAGHMGRGIAFSPYSDQHLLNVMAGKMSAFADKPDHFVDWILSEETYRGLDKDLIAKTYLPRSLYGRYLDFVWAQALGPEKKGVEIEVVEDFVTDIEGKDKFRLVFKKLKPLVADFVVLATGNSLPAPPEIPDKGFLKSANYFPDPWSHDTVRDVNPNLDVLIIGNGLTMVDTVLGLREAGFNNVIHSISPDGFSILQHRHNGLSYPNMVAELKEPYHLRTLVNLFNKHRKAIRTLGLSAEPVIDALRPFTQTIWMSLSVAEKKEFMVRLRHLWGVARHRLPIHIHDLIQRLKLDGKLKVRSGKILDITESAEGISMRYYNKKIKTTETIQVGRVINCTGPESDIARSSNELLRNLYRSGNLVKDALNQGAMAHPFTLQALKSDGKKNESLYLIGNILKGLLWESTAVPEIRVQAVQIAGQILTQLKTGVTAVRNQLNVVQ